MKTKSKLNFQNLALSEDKTVLTQEIKKWMSRAETLKDIKALEEKVMNDNISESVLDKQCLIQ